MASSSSSSPSKRLSRADEALESFNVVNAEDEDDDLNHSVEELDNDDGFEYVQREEKSAFPQIPLPQTKIPFRNPRSVYCANFADVFLNVKSPLAALKEPKTLKKASLFRHVAWAVLLDALPLPRIAQDWPGLVRSRRESYARLSRQRVICAEQRNNAQTNPEVNNPLSEDANCAWSKYIADEELAKEIARDVNRTNFPHHPLFVSKKIAETRQKMTSVLFMYAKKYPEMSYKQGMNEILAIILQVQFDSCQEYFKAFEPMSSDSASLNPDLLKMLSVINDVRFIEHDSFFLFERFIDKMWDWYYLRPYNTTVKICNGDSSLMDAKPFESLHGFAPTCAAARRLHYIWDNILQTHDPKLYAHLKELEILPTTFGTNWTKLLFSRQFPASDFLFLWDSIVASGFSLVDYIVVAMVIAIRSLLLEGDSIKCNALLVSKYPNSIDIKYVLAEALHVQEPLRHPMPNRSPFKFGLPYLQDISSKKLVKIVKEKSPKHSVQSQQRQRRPVRNAPEKKMINLGENAVVVEEEEPIFEFLGGELSSTKVFGADEDEICRWRDQIAHSVVTLRQNLPRQVEGDGNVIHEALTKMEVVLSDMTAKLKIFSRSDSIGVDALEHLTNDE